MFLKPTRLLAASFAALLMGALPAPTASAGPTAHTAVVGAGAATITVGGSGKAAKAFRSSGVKVRALAPARKRGKRIKLPIANVAVGKSARLKLSGGARLRAGKRSVSLRAVRLTLAPRRVGVTARIGKRRVKIFSARLAKGKAKLDREKVTARLAGAKLTLTPRGAKLLRARLAVNGIRAGALGKVGVNARPKSGGNGGPGGPKPGPAPPLSKEPPILARPAGAVDVTGGEMIWRPRDSWICYINGGEGTSVFGGVANGPSESVPCSSGPTSLVASFLSFPFKSGWAHPDGRVALYFGGGVGFRFSGHGINFTTADPEIEINGAASRAIFRFSGSDGTPFPNQRGVLIDTTPGAPQVLDGTTTYNDIPGRIPADTGASVFAGFYPEDAPFGTITVSFDTP